MDFLRPLTGLTDSSRFGVEFHFEWTFYGLSLVLNQPKVTDSSPFSVEFHLNGLFTAFHWF